MRQDQGPERTATREGLLAAADAARRAFACRPRCATQSGGTLTGSAALAARRFATRCRATPFEERRRVHTAEPKREDVDQLREIVAAGLGVGAATATKADAVRGAHHGRAGAVRARCIALARLIARLTALRKRGPEHGQEIRIQPAGALRLVRTARGENDRRCAWNGQRVTRAHLRAARDGSRIACAALTATTASATSGRTRCAGGATSTAARGSAVGRAPASGDSNGRDQGTHEQDPHSSHEHGRGVFHARLMNASPSGGGHFAPPDLRSANGRVRR